MNARDYAANLHIARTIVGAQLDIARASAFEASKAGTDDPDAIIARIRWEDLDAAYDAVNRAWKDACDAYHADGYCGVKS